MQEINFRIDWMAFTVWGVDDFKSFWAEFFEEKLGELSSLGHGGRGFREIFQSVTSAKVYINPISSSPKGNYFHVEINGDSTNCLIPPDFQAIIDVMRGGLDVRFSRIDLAFDNVPFSPIEFFDALKTDQISSRAKRGKYRIY